MTAPADNDQHHRERLRLETEVFYTSPFTVMGRMRSIRHAAMGIGFVLRSQHNAWVHAAVTVAVLALAAVLHFTVRPYSMSEWADLVIAIAMVWVAETFNTGLEVLANAITSERHPVVKIAKDVAAAAVLLSAIAASIVGLILFLPPLIELAKRLL